jgi:hypothetical protein
MTQGFPGDEKPHGFDLKPETRGRIVDLRYQSVPMVGRGFQWWPEVHHDGVLVEDGRAYVVGEAGHRQYLDAGDYVLHVDDGNPYDGHDQYVIYDEQTFRDHFEEMPDGGGNFRTKVLVEIRSIAAGLEGDAKAHALAHPMSSGDGYVIDEDVSAEAILHVLKCEMIGAILLAKGYGYEQHPGQPDELTPKRSKICEMINAAVSAAMLEV